jgi:hypothetical protein
LIKQNAEQNNPHKFDQEAGSEIECYSGFVARVDHWQSHCGLDKKVDTKSKKKDRGVDIQTRNDFLAFAGVNRIDHKTSDRDKKTEESRDDQFRTKRRGL